ncbi:MAG: phosphoribosylaminoimidazolesuccinocarboxamide synthase [Planctomycetota bacterium]|nr:MAG: phosphoribosylaminoimidazolesuccinocarboxamide synthase [Planctomycetota bacterium]
MVTTETVLTTSLPYPKRSGKVRDVYDLGDRLLVVSTDRISAFDWVLPVGIPGKGVVLTQLSAYWFRMLGVPHHFLTTDLTSLDLPNDQTALLRGRSMLVRKAEVIPFECVVRGYLEGSGWREYQQTGAICGIRLPPGLRQCDRLPEPIFTPATKAETGHDENVPFEVLVQELGAEVAERLRRLSLQVYQAGRARAEERGILIADTKFEWGYCDGEIILIDEVLTPDSSRFWPAETYQPGGPQPSFDKQFVREWLMRSSWDRNSPPPELPDDIVAETAARYRQAFELLTGQTIDQALAASQSDTGG